MKNTKQTNDKIAEYYDFIYSILRPSALIDSEISLINFLKIPGSKILDIGGGTGNHAIILSKLGFKVSVVDTSKEMLNKLKEKDTNSLIKSFNQSIFEFNTSEKYDLIILMWNTFNEIALTLKDADKLLQKISLLLKKDGKVLLNIDDADKINPGNFNFQIKKEENNKLYKLTWKTYTYTEKVNKSTSEELLEIYKNKEKIAEIKEYITQRYWSFNQIKKISKKYFKEITKSNSINSEELYMILSK